MYVHVHVHVQCMCMCRCSAGAVQVQRVSRLLEEEVGHVVRKARGRSIHELARGGRVVEQSCDGVEEHGAAEAG